MMHFELIVFFTGVRLKSTFFFLYADVQMF